MNDNVKSLADLTGNAIMQSPEQALNDAINNIGKNGAFEHGKKVLILALDDTTGEYNITFIQAGMKMSECLALCEISKSLFLESMGY